MKLFDKCEGLLGSLPFFDGADDHIDQPVDKNSLQSSRQTEEEDGANDNFPFLGFKTPMSKLHFLVNL